MDGDVDERPDNDGVDCGATEYCDRCRAVLKARKGEAHGYAAVLIRHCQSAAELPTTIREILETIHKALSAVPEVAGATPTDNPADWLT